MEVDPRLQLSDLTDYQFQSSLAQYNAYHTGNVNETSGGYFQPLSHDGTRHVGLGASQHVSSRTSPRNVQESQAEGIDISSLYPHTSIPASSIGFNAGRPTSNQSIPNRSHTAGNLNPNAINDARSTLPTRSANTQRSDTQSDSVELKDPTVFVPPHLLAPLKPNPPSLKEWRNKFFNIEEPLVLSEEQYLTYFPHVDNVYSHRSTQKYKRKPFVSHYWDCRLKGRPTGTPINKGKKVDDNGQEQEKKKRKRKVRERDLCDVKIKVTEYFGTKELEALRKLGLGPEPQSTIGQGEDSSDLTFVLNGQQQQNDGTDSAFGILEPAQNHPPGHPGAGGKKWYLVQRVNGNDKDGEDSDDRDLDHKHSLEESDRIKKNSVQRWLLAREKEKRKVAKSEANKKGVDEDEDDDGNDESTPSSGSSARFHATGFALQTLYSHNMPTSNNLTFYGSSFCPFAQRIWIALEFIGIPYHYVEITERHFQQSDGMSKLNIPELQDCNPESKIPCIKHNNFAVWESLVMLEYLEDLALGQSLFQPAVGNAQLKAHSRMWVDYINRRVLPIFYALLLLPDTDGNASSNTNGSTRTQPIINLAGRSAHANPESTRRNGMNDESYGMPIPQHFMLPNSRQCDPSTLTPRILSHPTNHSPQYNLKLQTLINTLHHSITTLVNASHRTGPFFLGPVMSYVDIAFAPWIIRLSRVLTYYRGFPRPEVGTRWQAWCDAIESNEVVRRTVSEEQSYRDVYGGFDSWEYDDRGRVNYVQAREKGTTFPEMWHARKIVDTEGFGLGGDIWGNIAGEDWSMRIDT